MSSFFAFLHHIAAFALFAALVVELITIKEQLTLKTARTLQIADLAFGISSGIVLVIGLLRVFYFEKGAAYYSHSIPFILKMSLFVFVGLLSIYPTMKFLSWRAAVRQGRAPDVDERTVRLIRGIVHMELGGVVLMILFAALMARGIGLTA